MAESFAVPDAVQKAAKQGLELRKKHGRGGTEVGLNTARILASGGSIGAEKARHVARYFDRHRGDRLDDKTSNGWIAWQLWGGAAGEKFAKGVVRRLDAKEALASSSPVASAIIEALGR